MYVWIEVPAFIHDKAHCTALHLIWNDVSSVEMRLLGLRMHFGLAISKLQNSLSIDHLLKCLLQFPAKDDFQEVVTLLLRTKGYIRFL